MKKYKKVQFESIGHLEYEMEKLMPDCQLEHDNQGMIVIYTGLKETYSGKLRTMRQSDFPEEK